MMIRRRRREKRQKIYATHTKLMLVTANNINYWTKTVWRFLLTHSMRQRIIVSAWVVLSFIKNKILFFHWLPKSTKFNRKRRDMCRIEVKEIYKMMIRMRLVEMSRSFNTKIRSNQFVFVFNFNFFGNL